jgi:Flp pilus assembly protein TadG
MRHATRRSQHGAVIITVALSLLVLLGFIGFALDFSRLFIVKTEMQTAMDSCALAAAQELDGSGDALTRATNAGRTAGNMNSVHFQRDAAGLVDTDVTFSNSLTGTYSHTYTPVANAKYAKCTKTKSGIVPWLLQAMSAFSGNPSYSANRSVFATAVATVVPSQSNCLVPVGMCQKSSASPMGFTRGEWILGASDESVGEDINIKGNFRWLDFTGNGGGAREVKDMLTSQGQCNLPGIDTITKVETKPGNTNGAVDAFNSRFGVYKGSFSADNAPPDFTGYAWYVDAATAPTSMQGRYDDTSNNGYQYHRTRNDPYEGDNQNPNTTGLKTQGSASSQATHQQRGSNRRVAPMPVVDCDIPKANGTLDVKGMACVLLLHPIEKKTGSNVGNIWIEYISDARATTNNPCATTGLPGGASGVQVPSLVQ